MEIGVHSFNILCSSFIDANKFYVKVMDSSGNIVDEGNISNEKVCNI